MIVKTTVSSCWLAPPEQITAAAEQVVAILLGAPDVTVFFRADDIGVPGDKCREMMEAFRAHAIPLHMAVTPAWLSESRWSILKEWAGTGDVFIWHQHGWRHQTHQLSGKKGEFGSDRPLAAKRSDLEKGKSKLEELMGHDFQPIFTPPWNRIDGETGEVLAELGFIAVSRWQGENKKVRLPGGLPDIPVNVDLHTRTETDPAESLSALVEQFQGATATGRVGVMLHHQRMNESAFSFLESLLKGIASLSSSRLLRL